MLLYFKDVQDLEALRIAMGYYFHDLAENIDNIDNISSQELLKIVSRFTRIIDQLDEELDYYEIEK